MYDIELYCVILLINVLFYRILSCRVVLRRTFANQPRLELAFESVEALHVLDISW